MDNHSRDDEYQEMLSIFPYFITRFWKPQVKTSALNLAISGQNLRAIICYRWMPVYIICRLSLFHEGNKMKSLNIERAEIIIAIIHEN